MKKTTLSCTFTLDEDIMRINAPPLPYDMDANIFNHVDEETGEIYGEPYSYNDWLKSIKDISGVNEELLGEKYEQN